MKEIVFGLLVEIFIWELSDILGQLLLVHFIVLEPWERYLFKYGESLVVVILPNHLCLLIFVILLDDILDHALFPENVSQVVHALIHQH